MNKLGTIFWCLCFVTAFKNYVRADDDTRSLEGSNETVHFNISRGIKLHIVNGEARIAVRMSALLNENQVQAKSTGRLKFQDTLKKVGMAMMMAPIVMQLISLPATIASIKISLLRSIFVGKMALLIMLYGVLKNSQKDTEVVLVHKPEYHKHFYHDWNHHHLDHDDEDWRRR